MKSSMMALAVGVALAGCSTGDGNIFASRDKTVEYYRVFDIKADPANPAVVKAASEGISRHIADATLATPSVGGDLQEQPGRFKLADPGSTAPGAAAPGAAARGPNCEGATWTARATPQVSGGDNMNMIACLFPYKNGYHLDMYAVFTEKEGGWLEWPRRVTGRLMGTPEKWTDQTMVDVVRSIRDSTGAQVALVEAKPALAGEPWLQFGPGTAAPASGSTGTPGAAGSATKVNSPSGASGAVASTAATPVANPASSIAPLTPQPAPASTAAAMPMPATPVAAPAPAPAASEARSAASTTVATDDTASKVDKTDVK